MTSTIWYGGEIPDLAAFIAQTEQRPTLVRHLGIEFTDIGAAHLCARMPVDGRTHQPMGLLHGGASVVLAETLASVAASLCVDRARQACVGLEINANHVRGVSSGWVIGTARPLHLGRSSQLWDIRISDERQRMVCISRCTMAVLDIDPQGHGTRVAQRNRAADPPRESGPSPAGPASQKR